MINELLLAEFERQRGALERTCARLQVELSALLPAQKIPVHFVSGRVKSVESLRRKLARPDRTYARLWDVTDLVGLRISTYFEDTIEDVARLIEHAYRVDFANSTDKLRFTDHGKFGYRSLHYVCAAPDSTAIDPAFRFEIQVRTVLQHAWAEVEHDLGYKTEDTVPDAIRRRFSRVASLLELADQEFVSIRRDLRQCQLVAREALTHPDRPLPLDVVSLVALTLSPEVAALDRVVAEAIDRPLSDEPYSPDYLVKLLRLSGLSSTRDVQEALARTSTAVPRMLPPYFDFAERTWNLGARSIDAVGRGYSLFFVAHAAVLSGPDLGISKVAKLTRVYNELDYPRDENAAQRVASGLANALGPVLASSVPG